MEPEPLVRDRRWTLVAVCTTTFMLLLDITVVNVALPNIQEQLHAGLTGLQWVVDAYALTLAALILTAGALADRYGRRLVFMVGVLVFSTASLLCGLAWLQRHDLVRDHPLEEVARLGAAHGHVAASQPDDRRSHRCHYPKCRQRGSLERGSEAASGAPIHIATHLPIPLVRNGPWAVSSISERFS